MTPADLAAALGVDVGAIGRDGWGNVACKTGGARWVIDGAPSRDSSHMLHYEADNTVIQVPITTTLTAAVTRVRRMLEIS